MFTLVLVLFILSNACNAQIEDAAKANFHLSANIGDNITLTCSYTADTSCLSWYKQAVGEAPRLISSFYRSASNNFHNEFANDPRFSLDPGEGIYNLQISNAQPPDAAVYLCGKSHVNVIDFIARFFLTFKEIHSDPVFPGPTTEPGHLGEPVNPNCSVHPGRIPNRIHGFRHTDSRKTNLGLFFTRSQSRGPRRGNSDALSLKQSCYYSLAEGITTSSDPGTHECAVASCSQMLLGDGPRPDTEKNQNGLLALLPWLTVALTVSLLFNLVLASLCHKTSRRLFRQTRGTLDQSSGPAHISEGEDVDGIPYAALSFNQRAMVSSQHNSEEEGTLYSALRHQN